MDRKEENEFEDFENLRYGEANLNETKEMIDDMLIEEIDVDDLQNDIHRKLALKMKQTVDQEGVKRFATSNRWTTKAAEEREDETHLRSTNEVKVVLKAGEVFRVPLCWLMRDSKIDLLIQTERPGVKEEDQSLIMLYKDI